jgi:DNA-directed RNA polymerase subunit K/omega
MAKSIFDREVFFKMEQMGNPFVAARALSKRAREVNARQKEQEVEDTVSAPAVALEDFVEGRIQFTNTEDGLTAAD